MSPEDSAAALPRRQAGASPQHLLATLLGEYFDPAGGAVPSAALVALMAEFSVSATSARTALSRVARRGLLQAVRRGRTSAYRLTPEALSRHKQRMQHFLTFGSASPSFTGEWTVVAFSVSEEQRPVRAALRRELQGLRFGRLFDSVWVRPDDHIDAVRAVVAEVSRGGGEVGASVMLSRFAPGRGVVDPLSAFDLTGLGADYSAFTARFAPLRARTRDGAVPPAEALVARTELMDTWRAFTDTDPDLPAELLPEGWERDGARRTFLEIHTVLGPVAEQRLRQIVAQYSAEAADAVRHYSAGW